MIRQFRIANKPGASLPYRIETRVWWCPWWHVITEAYANAYWKTREQAEAYIKDWQRSAATNSGSGWKVIE